jgi:MoaA/NifB/PqqE/SkfB family radical SAM enzyme
LRQKDKFVNKHIIFDLLEKEKNKEILNFFWGNSLLHPNLLEIIKYAKNIWFKSIGLLTNSFWLDNYNLDDLKKNNLNSFWIYFNNFSEKKHNLIVWKKWIKLDKLLKNIKLLKQNNFFVKVIIHINKQNINNIYKDILVLNKKYGINNFEFINYFPFDRPYNDFRNILEYDIKKNIENVDKLFLIIKKLQLSVNFVKFSKDLFWKYKEFYNFEKGILEQIWEEDLIILDWKEEPFCKIEKRCYSCFLKDKCKWYEV